MFGGDGASLLIPPGAPRDRRGEPRRDGGVGARELRLTLRAALVPVAAVRAAGHDLRVARYAASADVTYAMFTGGGLAWAEAAMKTGAHAVAASRDGAPPDLTGLSCRFAPVANRDRLVLSLIVLPCPKADPVQLRAVLEDVLAFIDAGPESGRPLPAAGPGCGFPGPT